MNVDFINFSCANKQITENHCCPLSCEPFIRPWILLEDGFTYEKSYIEEWLKKKPNYSPMIGDIPSATLLPNCALTKANLVCSITQEPFKEPFFKSDMSGAAFSPECYLEKGDTWQGITNWSDFLSELKNRGALNVDTVSLRNLS